MEVITDKEARRHLYEQFLKNIDREESLVGQRQTWGLQLNIALLAAIWAVLNFADKAPLAVPPNLWIALFSVIGSFVSWSAFRGVQAAHNQADYLIKKVELRLGIKGNEWENSEFLRPYGEPKKVHAHARSVARSIPFVLCTLWLICLGFMGWNHRLDILTWGVSALSFIRGH